MTKSQLIEKIAKQSPHVPRREVEAIVNVVFEQMSDALRRDERIEIRGFGSFAVKLRRARQGRNPKTGKSVSVPERRTPYFTVGKELRERLNRGEELTQPAVPVSSGGYTESATAMAASSADGGRYSMS